MSNKEIILKYFPDVTKTQTLQFEQLQQLYVFWNDKINVVSRKDIQNLAVNHILHSLSIAKSFSFSKNSCILDLGTGGGLPGIPLSIMFPNTHFMLVDSTLKKLKVVNEIISELNLKNVETLHERVENINQEFDFVVNRAVAPIDVLWNWSKNLISTHKNNGMISLKGGDLTKELSLLNKKYKIIDISTLFEEDYFKEKKIVYIKK